MMTLDKMTDQIHRSIRDALAEDLGTEGDITSKAIFSESDLASAVIRSKSNGILSGIYLIDPIFKSMNSSVMVTLLNKDSSTLEPGAMIAQLSGPVNDILAAERTILNFLQRLSGIATVTSKYVAEIAHTSTRLLDTRKTTPGLRYLEKLAVVHGGGCNHRIGLFDMILIKDTHVKRSGGVANALKKVIDYRESDNKSLKIEVEVQSIDEFHTAIEFNPDRIMLDNMTTESMRHCVNIIKEKSLPIETEASGNITLTSIRKVAETGVDFISSGSITHSAPSLDIHLLIS
jgi:nicotinate-nucleotide pyrophosphorylase (carboxylating)